MLIEFVAPDAALSEKSVLAVVVFEGQVEAAEGGAYARAVAAGRFTGAKGQVLDVMGAQAAGACG